VSSLGHLVRKSLFPLGSVATIRRGPLRGMRYRVTEESGWAPILGRWEPEAQRAYAKLIRPGDVVWDLGANTGIHTLLFARLVGAAGAVYAFEPVPPNIAQIRETCRLNDVSNVIVVEKAVSDSCEAALFHMGMHDKQGSLVGIGCETGDTLKVACTTMDVALAETRAPDFVKIDIEGAESRALAGFDRVSESRPTFAIDLHTPSEDVAVGRWLAAHDYRAFRLLDTTARAYGASASEFAAIESLEQGWPERSGIWGTVIAAHPARAAIVRTLEGG